MVDAVIRIGGNAIKVNLRGGQGLPGAKGDPGGDLGQIGTFADLQGLDVLDVQPGATLIRLTDRPGPWRLWESGMPALNPSYEDVSWTYDGSGTAQWFYSPEQGLVVTGLGVDATGTVDATGPLTTTTGRLIQGAGGEFKAGPVNLKTQERWDGGNAKVTTPNDGTTVFLAGNAVHDWRICDFQLYGHRSGTSDPDVETECGVQIRDATRGIISNTAFFNFKKAGLIQNANSFANEGGTGRGARTIGYGLGFYKCTIGLKTEINGGNEYSIFGLLHAGGCQIGAELRAGNTILAVFNLVDNDDNLHLTGDLGSGSNHLHGITAIGSISHSAESGYLAHFKDVWRGHTLLGIHAYAANSGGAGPVFYQRTGGVNWSGGVLDALTYVNQNATGGGDAFDADAFYPYNRQENLFMPGDYGPAVIYHRNDANTAWQTYSPHIIRRNCFGPGAIDADGVSTNDPADLYVSASQPGPVAFTSGDYLKFASVDSIGDRRRCYDPATGLITIPTWMDGRFRYNSSFVISGALATPESTSIELLRTPAGGNPATDGLLISVPFMPMPYGAGNALWIISIPPVAWNFRAGDRVGLRITGITGASRFLGHATWPNSQFEFEKIA